MAKPFSQLYDKMPSEAKARVEARVQATLLEMNLQELRQQLTQLTQEDVAALLKVTQSYVSRVERRSGDILLSTLRTYVQALGGEVEIRVRVPGKDEVRLRQDDPINLEALTTVG